MLNIIEYLENHMASCQFKSITGFDCLGCGFQRSFIALLKGDLLLSIQLYPGLIPFFITILLVAYQLIFQKEKGGYYILYSFITTTIIVLGNFILKLCL